MPYRINGTGTTISPLPAPGKHSITMHWFTLLFIPVIPLGWQLVKGTGYEQYCIIKELSYSEVKNIIGTKGMLLTIGYGYFVNILTLFGILILMYIFG